MSLVQIVCPHCKRKLKVPAHAHGRRARCKRCGHVFTIFLKLRGKLLEDSVYHWLTEEKTDEPGD